MRLRLKIDRTFVLKYFLPLIVFITLMGVYYFLMSTSDDINEQNKQYLEEISLQNANIVKRMVKKDLDRLNAVANIIGSEERFTIDRAMKVLNAESEFTDFKRLAFVPENGVAMTTDCKSFSVLDREYFQKALNGQGNVSDKLVDKTDNSFIHVFSVPLYHRDKIKGVVFATISTDNYANLLSVENFSGEGFSYIVRCCGELEVYSTHNKASDKFDNVFDELSRLGTSDAELDKMRNNMAANINGTIEYKKDGDEFVAAYSRIGVNDWFVLSVAPRSVMFSHTDRLLQRNLIWAALVMGMFLFLLSANIYTSKKNRTNLEKLAYYDELTGAKTFTKFKLDAAALLQKAGDHGHMMAKIDIDGFRLINELYGYDMGDKLIIALSKAIGDAIDVKHDIYARIAADEFVLLLSFKDKKDLEAKRAIFTKNITSSVATLVGCKITIPEGRYMVEKGETDVISIFEKTNFAHRLAKHSATPLRYYDERLRAAALYEREIENMMESALKNREFKLYLQPKYYLADETIAGAEALVRWETKEQGILPPSVFIPLFEQNGFITKLDMYMLNKSCKIISAWIESGIEPVTISVNFSRLHLRNKGFVRQLSQIADKYGVPHHFIEIELTETVLFDNIEILGDVLDELHKAGFTLSMDDFGTGYSSLGLLKDICVDVIKIDRSFFDQSVNSQRARTVIASVMEMAKRLGIVTVAEGVETKATVDILRGLGCDIVQGYYYAKPMKVEEFELLKL